ncbi:MAG TPA: ATP-dependent DNA helicase RecG [Candidatus Binataceae bacterium]|nr:ATP-dependent DNA helicase RecG [Candidatus Binataceae bacterium]
MPLEMQTLLSALSGVGPKRAAALADRGIATVADLLFNLPLHYQDWRARTPLAELKPATSAVVEGRLVGLKERPMRGMRWRRMATGWLEGAGGARLRVVWFNLPAYMKGRMPDGERVVMHGRVGEAPDGGLEIIHPEVYPLDSGAPPAVRPVYGLPTEIGQRIYAGLVAQALAALGGRIEGAMPAALRVEAGVMAPGEALRTLHQPPADAEPAKLEAGDSAAHFALAFDEMFAFQLAMGIDRMRAARRIGARMDAPAKLTARLLETLPFTPTRAQLRAIDEIGAGLARTHPMNRLLMGDVGSGKTLVALWAALRAAESGWQVAMMAPTELLAEQHYRSFTALCGALGVPAALLLGKTPPAERARTLRLLASGAIALVFGTHALIQEGVALRSLGLAVIDEQHRFGVFDRARLKALGPCAHVLLMTATPIPRSLALTLLANLDISALDEMPPGRTPVLTEIFTEAQIAEVDAIVRAELEAGRRAYYIVPLIEAEEESDERLSVAATARRLGAGLLDGFKIGTLHGRMRPADKERAMRAFRDGALDVLVSTTVVEVGIDVPEASVIVVIAAERYGLAQLHQLRGRVGRGAAASRCCLVVSRESVAPTRLDVMVRTNSGAEIARVDLELRGPGDLLGARQSGALPLRFAEFIRDGRLIEQSRAMAESWLKRDPSLELPDSAGARAALLRMLDFGFSLGDIG